MGSITHKIQSLVKTATLGTVGAVADELIARVIGQRSSPRGDAGHAAPITPGWTDHHNGTFTAPTGSARRMRELEDAQARCFAVVRTQRHANNDRPHMGGGGEPIEFISARMPEDLKCLRRSEAALLRRLLHAEDLDHLL